MFENLNEELSEYLKLLRFKRKVSQEEIANELGISRNTYATWEKRPIEQSLENLDIICKKLNGNVIVFFKEYVAKSNKD